jgi:hypothetical protein
MTKLKSGRGHTSILITHLGCYVNANTAPFLVDVEYYYEEAVKHWDEGYEDLPEWFELIRATVPFGVAFTDGQGLFLTLTKNVNLLNVLGDTECNWLEKEVLQQCKEGV